MTTTLDRPAGRRHRLRRPVSAPAPSPVRRRIRPRDFTWPTLALVGVTLLAALCTVARFVFDQ